MIGAGASGLVATKECLDEGLHPVCYESSQSLGGLWHYHDNDSDPSQGSEEPRGSVFKSTKTIFSRELFCFSDFPVPTDFPEYLHNTHVYEYLSMYANKFGLLQFISFGVQVEHICQQRDQEEDNPGWVVRLLDRKTGRRWEESFEAVMICTGHHSQPFIPDVKV